MRTFFISLLFFYSASIFANPYENAKGSVNAGETLSCDTNGETPASRIAAMNEGQSSENGSPKRIAYVEPVVFNGGNCNQAVVYRWDSWRTNPDGSRWNEKENESYFRIYGNTTLAPSCLNLPDAPNNQILGKNGEQWKCYTAKSLADADTCQDTPADETYISSVGGASCMPQPDGSVCPVNSSAVSEITTADGTTHYFYKPNLNDSSGTCYQSSMAFEDVSDVNLNENMPSSGCEIIGGINYCAESEANVCDGYGNCSPGCGTVTSGTSTNVVCASPDFDGDGVPDYQDPDKDGDGIPNEQDLDNDNDGFDDPRNPFGGGTTTMPFTPTDVQGINTMLSGIRTNTSATSQGISGLQGSINGLTAAIQNGAVSGGGGSGAGGGTSTGEQGIQDGIDELKEELTEGEFTALGNRENTWSTLFDDSFLEDMETQKENLSTQFNQEFNTIKSEFSSLVQITSVGGSFESRQMSLKGVDVDVSLSRFSDMFSIIGLVMVFMATVYSMFIVIGGK